MKVNVMKDAEFTARMYELSPAEVEELEPFIHDLLSRTALCSESPFSNTTFQVSSKMNGRSVLVAGYLYVTPTGPLVHGAIQNPRQRKTSACNL